MKKQHYKVSGMACDGCRAAVDRVVRRLDGVEDVRVDLQSGEMVVELDSARVSSDQIVGAVERAGFVAEPIE